MPIDPLLVAKCGDKESFLLPELANRHGLITGATGTGKTVTQTLRANPEINTELKGVYDQAIDRESAYEKLTARAEQNAQAVPKGTPNKSVPIAKPVNKPAAKKTSNSMSDILLGTGRREGVIGAAAKSAARTAGNQLMRGILGSLTGGKK